MASAAADEPGTLRYDWFEDDDPDKFVVIEDYVDAAAAFAHNANCEQLLVNAFALADSLPAAKTYRPLA